MSNPLSNKLAKKEVHTSRLYAEEYDDKIVKIIPHYYDLLDHTVLSLPFEESHKIDVLELGFGTGNLTSRILSHFPKSKIVGIDYSSYMPERTRRKLRNLGIEESRFTPVCGDITELDYSSYYGRFDTIIGSLVFHDLTTSEFHSFLGEAYKLLNDRGVIILGDVIGMPSPQYKRRVFRGWVRALSKYMSSEAVNELFQQPEMREMMETVATVKDHHKSLSAYDLGHGFEVSWKLNNFATIVSWKSCSRQERENDTCAKRSSSAST